LNKRAVGSLHEFGRYVNDLEYRARQTFGAEDAKVLLLEWLKDIDYEKHLYENEDTRRSRPRAGPMCWTSSTGWPSVAAARSRTMGA
jgi:hypothetical protein